MCALVTGVQTCALPISVRGEPDAAVRVILPASVDLEGGDGRTARVTGLVTDLSAAPRLGPDGRLQFRFGGRLLIAGLDDGDYRGRIPVTVEYQYGEGRLWGGERAWVSPPLQRRGSETWPGDAGLSRSGVVASGSAQGRFTTPNPSSRSEEHTSELQSLMRISYAVFCLKKKQYY